MTTPSVPAGRAPQVASRRTSRGLLVLERNAHVGELVGIVPGLDERTAVFCHPRDGAVVLGSTQREADLDLPALARAGLGVARRRSGGGAIVVAPQRQLWLDLFLPVSDPLFQHDVLRAAEVVGEIWVEALVRSGMDGGQLAVHQGGLRRAPFSSQVCFLGLGPGEVCWRGCKLVGLSQRRDRRGSWFFTMAPYVVEPELEASLFVTPTGAAATLSSAIREGVRELPELPGLEEQLLQAIERR